MSNGKAARADEYAMNIEDLKTNLKTLLKINKENETDGIPSVSVSLIGPAGIAKTSSVKQLEKEGIDGKSVKVVKVSMANIEESGDITGYPLTEFECQLENGDMVWLPKEKVADYKTTGKSRMGFAIPKWLQEGRDSNADYKILLLDDYSRATPQILQCCMSIIDEKSYISWELGPEWTIILTQNPDNDSDYVVNSLDAAQESRFLSWYVKYDNNIWCNWALETGIDRRCINFILAHHREIYGGNNSEINPRIITKFFNSIRNLPNFSDSKNMLYCQTNAAGIAPEGRANSFAQVFLQFVNNKLDELPEPDELMAIKDKKEFCETFQKLLYSGGSFRQDIATILSFRLVHYIGGMAKMLTEEQIDNLGELLVQDFMQEELSYALMDSLKRVSRINKDILGRLAKSNEKLWERILDLT